MFRKGVAFSIPRVSVSKRVAFSIPRVNVQWRMVSRVDFPVGKGSRRILIKLKGLIIKCVQEESEVDNILVVYPSRYSICTANCFRPEVSCLDNILVGIKYPVYVYPRKTIIWRYNLCCCHMGMIRKTCHDKQIFIFVL